MDELAFPVAAMIYCLPTIVALARRRVSIGWVFMLNLFLGWTGFFWLYALVLACTGETMRDVERRRRIEHGVDEFIKDMRDFQRHW